MAGTEETQLVGALERLRTTFRFKADGLDAAGLDKRIGASSLTLGGLLKHLAINEDYMFAVKYAGESLGEPWPEVDWDANPDWEFSSAAIDEPETLYALWDGAVERSRRRLAAALAKDGGLDQRVAANDDHGGEHASLRRLVTDLIEEYGRHTGHADLIREAVDGVTGEDPPERLASRVRRLPHACWLSGNPDAMPEMPHTLTAALHREEDWFIAQCLEVDVASQGRTIDEALAGLAEAVELYLEEAR